MNAIRWAALAALTALALSSCGLSSQPQAEPAPALATRTPVPSSPQPLPASTPASAPATQRTLYTLSVSLDYERHHVAVSQTVIYLNRTAEALPDLVFVVEPNRLPGVFHLDRLTWAGGRPIEVYALEGPRLTVPLATPLSPGEAIELSILFQLDVPGRPGPFGYTARQMNMGDWYPFVPPYRAGQGWLIAEPSAAGEHLSYDVAAYQVEISAMPSRPDLTIAASAPFDAGAGQYRIDAARSFAWSAGAEYRVLAGSSGSTTVSAYVFPEHLGAGEAALQATIDALGVYANRFAPYPYARLTLVEADFPDGMEYSGLYFLGQEYYAAYDGTPQNYLTAIAVHETAHQWWYNLVGNDQANEPWLDEALATYSELLFYEAVYPNLADWWWTFRVRRFEPAGWVDSRIYDHSGFRPYVDAVYLRGARFVEELRRSIGDEAFFALLSDYVERGRFNQMTGADFFAILAMHTTVDPERLISDYFRP